MVCDLRKVQPCKKLNHDLPDLKGINWSMRPTEFKEKNKTTKTVLRHAILYLVVAQI